MIQLDNLASLILENTAAAMGPQDFGNVFQDLVEVSLRHANRPGLAAQGNAGNPDHFWNDGTTSWGWEVKSYNTAACTAEPAAVNAMAQFTHKRLVYLHTSVAPYTLYVANLEGFAGAQFNPSQLPQLEDEERELADSLNELLRCMNSTLYTEVPANLVEQAMDPRRNAAVQLLGW
jgi:hypothetical protein